MASEMHPTNHKLGLFYRLANRQNVTIAIGVPANALLKACTERVANAARLRHVSQRTKYQHFPDLVSTE